MTRGKLFNTHNTQEQRHNAIMTFVVRLATIWMRVHYTQLSTDGSLYVAITVFCGQILQIACGILLNSAAHYGKLLLIW